MPLTARLPCWADLRRFEACYYGLELYLLKGVCHQRCLTPLDHRLEVIGQRHRAHRTTHRQKVCGHATLLGVSLLSYPSVECAALARPRSSHAQLLALSWWQVPPELLNSGIALRACSWAVASGRGPRACSPLLLRRPTASCSTCGTPSPSSGLPGASSADAVKAAFGRTGLGADP